MPCLMCDATDAEMQQSRKPFIPVDGGVVCYDCGTVKTEEPDYLMQGYRKAFGDGKAR